MARLLRWLLEVPNEKRGMSDLGRDCGEGTGEVMWCARQWKGPKVTSCFLAWTMVREHRRRSRMYRIPGAHPSGVVQCVWHAVAYLGLRLRRSDWLEPESWGEINLLVMEMEAMESDGKSLSLSGFCFFQFLTSRN